MANTFGIKQIRVNSAIHFSHSSIKEKLSIPSGANSIKWHYTLNTNVTPTIGGEVTQLLSAYVGPMIIEGTVPNRDELNRLKEWFLQYMELAGTSWQGHWFRNEMAVAFSYPARNWSFYLQPTNFEGFQYDKSIYAIPWQITAEIVSDNALNFLSGVTMTAFTGPLANPAFVQVGYSDPTGTGKASRFVNPLLGADIPHMAATMGDNFQRLTANWVTGNFADFAYGSLTEGIANPNLKDPKQIYQDLFGSPGVSTSPSSGTTNSGGYGSGTYVYSGPANPTSVASIVAEIAAKFSAKGIPAQLGVAVSLQESSLNPDNRNPNDGGSGVDGVGLYQVHYGGRVSSAPVRAASITNRSDPPTKHYPSDQQITDAANWFTENNNWGIGTTFDANDINTMAQWAQSAQASANTYYNGGKATTNFQSHWAQAATYLGKYATLSTSSSSGASGTISGFTYFSQYDVRWKNSAYGSGTIGPDGCGITSMAMIVSNLTGKEVDPDVLASNYGVYYRPGSGSSWSLFPAVAQQYHLTEHSLGTNFPSAINTLNAGGLVVAAGAGHSSSDLFTTGHILVIRATSNGGFYLADPNTSKATDPNNVTLFSQQDLVNGGLEAMFGIQR